MEVNPDSVEHTEIANAFQGVLGFLFLKLQLIDEFDSAESWFSEEVLEPLVRKAQKHKAQRLKICFKKGQSRLKRVFSCGSIFREGEVDLFFK